MQPSFSKQSTQIKPFGNGNGNGNGTVNTRNTCETPQQPSRPLSICATGVFSSGANIGVGMIRPL